MNEPALWAGVNGITRSDVRKVSGEFIDEIGRMSGRCLDIGTGPGDIAVDFILPKLNSKAHLVCSDISEKMVNFGKKKYKDNPRVSFMKLDIESPDLPDDLIEEFDHIVSFYCLHWCPDMRQAFQNISNLLRPGGTALLSFLADTPVFDTYESLAAMPQYQPYMEDADQYISIFHHDKQQLKNLEDLIGGVGFDIHHCSYRENIYTFNRRDEIDGFMQSLNPFIERMPADLKAEYRKDLVKEITEHCDVSRKNGNIEDEYRILYHPFVVYLTKPVPTW